MPALPHTTLAVVAFQWCRRVAHRGYSGGYYTEEEAGVGTDCIVDRVAAAVLVLVSLSEQSALREDGNGASVCVRDR